MFNNKFMCKCLEISCLFIVFGLANGSIFDYFPLSKSLFGDGDSNLNDYSNELATRKVPYEIEVTDEKFIEQAAKFTGVSLSELDKCQHRVIFKLKSECHKLNDEDLAKLAVKLLNCQSSIEGRTIYPCTDEMPIRDCTSSMDPDTWNSYLLMSNRARAVCYSTRQAQFRGLTEMTVNKLMGSAHEQLNLMSKLTKGQARVELATKEAFETVSEDTKAMREQQRDLQKAQLHGQLALEDNIRRLANEKQLIIEGHEQLAIMTRDVQEKLDEAAKQLDEQAEERRDNHKEILNDLIEIQKQAQAIFSRIEESSRELITSSAAAADQYESTLRHLAQVNATVAALGGHVQWLGAALERHIQWLATALGGTDNTLDRLYIVTAHAMFLLLAMVACAFLQVGPAGRVGLVVLVPSNLGLALQRGHEAALTVQGLTLATVTFIIAQSILNFSLRYWYNRGNDDKKYVTHAPIHVTDNTRERECESEREHEVNERDDDDTFDSTAAVNSSFCDSFSYRNGSRYNTSTYRKFDIDSDNQSAHGDMEFASPTPPLSRLSRSRSNTPALNGLTRHKCSATTRMGTPCKSTALLGRDFCYRHQTGSSVIVQ